MYHLKELKIDEKLIKDLPKYAKISLTDEKLVERVCELLLAGKNNKKNERQRSTENNRNGSYHCTSEVKQKHPSYKSPKFSSLFCMDFIAKLNNM